MKLVEEAIEKYLNVGSNAPVLKLADSEIFHMAVHPNKGMYTDDDTDKVADEHISTTNCITLTSLY
jgi:hypothetical protein